jgi:hypothetical protein
VLSIDAVPAFALSGADYEIQDQIAATWIKTNPDTYRAQATAKNKTLDGCGVPLVKMVKGWNRASGRPIKPSFLIEVMAEELVGPPFSDHPNEVRNFFPAAEAIGQTWPDPAGLGSSRVEPDDACNGGSRKRGAAGRPAQGDAGVSRRGDRSPERRTADVARDPRRLFSAVVSAV